ncbi:MAG: DUF2442 domain-containing protein [Magnetococcus sp. DMHC-1]
MNPKVVAVKVYEPHSLVLSFANGERRCFDVSPYLDKGIFRELRDFVYFRSVLPQLKSDNSIFWLSYI